MVFIRYTPAQVLPKTTRRHWRWRWGGAFPFSVTDHGLNESSPRYQSVTVQLATSCSDRPTDLAQQASQCNVMIKFSLVAELEGVEKKGKLNDKERFCFISTLRTPPEDTLLAWPVYRIGRPPNAQNNRAPGKSGRKNEKKSQHEWKNSRWVGFVSPHSIFAKASVSLQ